MHQIRDNDILFVSGGIEGASFGRMPGPPQLESNNQNNPETSAYDCGNIGWGSLRLGDAWNCVERIYYAINTPEVKFDPNVARQLDLNVQGYLEETWGYDNPPPPHGWTVG